MFKQFMPRENQVEEMECVEQLWTERWLKIGFENDLSHLKTTDYFRILRRHLEPGSRLIEGGCGQGQWVRFLADHGFDVTGVELSQATVEAFRARYPAYDVRTGDVFKLEFADNTFDGYLSFGVIEHFEAGPGPILTEAWRVLRPQGLFCVSVPYMSGSKRRRFRGREDNRSEFPAAAPLRFYQYVMSKEELQSHLEATRFEVLRTYPADAGHTLKSRSPLVRSITTRTRHGGGLVRAIRPILRKAWHLYVRLQSREKHAHMIFAVCRANK